MQDLAILGSGFGAYTYLPAAVQTGNFSKIYCLPSFFDFVSKRSDISHLKEFLTTCRHRTELLSCCQILVSARRPQDQQELIYRDLQSSTFDWLYLEKPLAISPKDAFSCHEALVSRKTNYSINYSICRLPLWEFSPCEPLFKLKWNFMAAHWAYANQNRWKRCNSEGGGSLRFYGIHLIALAAKYGFTKVITSSVDSQYQSWRCILENISKQRLVVSLDSFSLQSVFSLETVNSTVFRLKTPFDGVSQANDATSFAPDPRISITVPYLCSHTYEPKSENLSFKLRVLDLWSEIEAYTEVV